MEFEHEITIEPDLIYRVTADGEFSIKQKGFPKNSYKPGKKRRLYPGLEYTIFYNGNLVVKEYKKFSNLYIMAHKYERHFSKIGLLLFIVAYLWFFGYSLYQIFASGFVGPILFTTTIGLALIIPTIYFGVRLLWNILKWILNRTPQRELRHYLKGKKNITFTAGKTTEFKMNIDSEGNIVGDVDNSFIIYFLSEKRRMKGFDFKVLRLPKDSSPEEFNRVYRYRVQIFSQEDKGIAYRDKEKLDLMNVRIK